MMFAFKIVWWCFFSVGWSALLARGQSCPRSEVIRPCTCQPTPVPSTTTCLHVRDLRTLEKAFRDSLDHPMPRLNVVESHFSYFPAQALKNKSIRHLEIERSVMVGLFDRIPEENHKLEKLKLYVTKVLRRIDWRMFRNLKKLTHLQIKGSKMGRIGREFRDHVPTTIDYLMLGDTRVAWLEDRVFDKLTRARHLQVSHGKIRTLKRSMFPKENKITALGFNDNRISHLPADIFSDMPKLTVLYLDGNRFSTLPEKVFGQVYARSVMLTLTGNNFVCDCRIRWIVVSEAKGRLDAKCYEPSTLRGKPIKEIPSKELEYCKEI